jgi:diguanylate cyclase (GGDEF)-like protein
MSNADLDPRAVPQEATGRARRTVLVAEDDPMFRRLLQKRLQDWGYVVAAVDNGEDAWRILQRPGETPALVILDWLMPGMDGIEICRRIRAQQQQSYQYVLLISGKDDKQDVVEGLEAGADDYLTKPFDTSELRARVMAGARIVALQQDLLQAQEELRYKVTHDTLTGVWSRGAVLDLLKCELSRAVRVGASTGVLMVDVDHFKRINDAHGHIAGDEVLKEIAARVSRSLRSYDLVGRFGGEEFIAILSNCAGNDLRLIAERALRAVSEKPIHTQSKSVSVTVSIGGFVAQDGTSDAELLQAADSALYQAKQKGRNCVVVGNPSLQTEAKYRTKTSRVFSI